MRSRTAAVVLGLASLLASGCAQGDGDASDVGAGVSVDTPGEVASSMPPSSAPGASTTRPPVRPGAVTVTTRPGASANAPSGAPSESPPTTAASGDDGRTGPPGAYARTLLRPVPAMSIAVEVLTQAGAQLRPGTAAFVEEVLEDSTAKEVTLSGRTFDESTPAGGWRESTITSTADRLGQQAPSGSRAVVRFLVLKGGFAPDENAIGVAVRGDVFAIFVDKITGAATPLVDAATIEQAVAVHEVGHLLGLVDIALDRDRDDPDHPFHSRNRGSVMFWAIETDLVGQILSGPPPRTFDQDDRADLAALRSGA